MKLHEEELKRKPTKQKEIKEAEIKRLATKKKRLQKRVSPGYLKKLKRDKEKEFKERNIEGKKNIPKCSHRKLKTQWKNM